MALLSENLSPCDDNSKISLSTDKVHCSCLSSACGNVHLMLNCGVCTIASHYTLQKKLSLPYRLPSSWFCHHLVQDGHGLLLTAGIPQLMTGQSGFLLDSLERRLINRHCCPEGAGHLISWGLKAERPSGLN